MIAWDGESLLSERIPASAIVKRIDEILLSKLGVRTTETILQVAAGSSGTVAIAGALTHDYRKRLLGHFPKWARPTKK